MEMLSKKILLTKELIDSLFNKVSIDETKSDYWNGYTRFEVLDRISRRFLNGKRFIEINCNGINPNNTPKQPTIRYIEVVSCSLINNKLRIKFIDYTEPYKIYQVDVDQWDLYKMDGIWDDSKHDMIKSLFSIGDSHLETYSYKCMDFDKFDGTNGKDCVFEIEVKAYTLEQSRTLLDIEIKKLRDSGRDVEGLLTQEALKLLFNQEISHMLMELLMRLMVSQ